MLSLLLTGTGHVYTGRPRRGAALWLATFGLALAGFYFVVVLPSAPALVALLVLLLVPPIAVAVDAWSLARAAGDGYALRWYNRWYWYGGAFVLASFVVQPGLKSLLEGTMAKAYRLPSGSMAPAFEAGDFLLVSPLRTDPRRGDVVAYRSDGRAFLKRVAAGPGDTVAMRDGQLLVNGRAVPEPYATYDPSDRSDDDFTWQRDFLAPGVDRTAYVASLQTWGPLLVPPRSYFMLGDNRGNSLDSRHIGFVSRDSITARPFMVYLSWDADAHSVRWGRLGLAR